jgi:hypothetical protein
MAALFLAFLAGQTLTGLHTLNAERADEGQPALALHEYVTSGHFLSATAENWESEFLQMAAYVAMTAFLFQRGSSESKKPGGKEAVDRDPRAARGERLAKAPWPVRRGGWVLRLYEYSLSLAFLMLFLVSFGLHAAGSARDFNEERAAQGDAPLTLLQYLEGPRFWFESFQNWQSEFLAILAMVVLSIHLRQRGSPESKPVDAPHSQTGSE